METNYFSRTPRGGTTLQDLLSMAMNDPDAPIAPSAPSQPSSVEPSGSLYDDATRSRLLEALFQPADIGPEPEVQKPSTLAMIFSGLGDAVSGFNAGRTGNSGLRTDAFGEYLGRLREQKEKKEDWRRRKAQEETKSRQGKASFLLGEDERQRMRADEAFGRKELKQLEVQAKEADRVSRESIAAETVAARLEEIASREKIAEMETKARRYSDSLQAKLHAKKKTDEADKDQHAEYAKSRLYVIGKKAEWMQRLADGKTSPDQILEEWQDVLDASDLTGDYREAADAFFKDKIGSILMRHAPVQGPQPAPAPTQGTIGGALRGIGNTLKDTLGNRR